MKKTTLFSAVFLLAFCTASFSKLLMAPYLQAVTESSVCVMAEADSPENVVVEYGPGQSYGSAVETSFFLKPDEERAYVHRIFLKGLKPASTYHYRLSHDKGEWTGDFYFRTAPEKKARVRLAWMADFRTGVEIHDMIAKLVKAAKPGVMLFGGDMCMDGGKYDDYKREFFRPNELDLISHIPFFGAVGNHDGWDENTKAFLQAPESGSGTQSYYSLDYGPVHVLVMNNYDPDGYSAGSAQYRFAQADAAASKAPWKIVMSHNPTYSSDIKHGNDAKMIAMADGIFEPAGFCLALAGHAHIYQHNYDGKMDFFIIGSVGAPLYTPEPMTMTVKTAGTYCYAVIDADAKSLVLNAYDEKGSLIETFTLPKK